MATSVVAVLLLVNSQLLTLAVFLVALVVAALCSKYVTRKYSDHVTLRTYYKCALTGLLTALVALVAEFLVVMSIEIFPDPSLATPVAFIAVASLVETFLITALFEEASKVIAMRMVVSGEAEPSTSFILANAAASSLTLATVENVAHMSYRIVHRNAVVNWVVFFIRPVLSVPIHICWGLTNGANFAVRRRTRQVLRRSVVLEMLPSVFLHGLWGFPFLLSYKGKHAIVKLGTDQPTEELSAEYAAGTWIALVCLFLVPVLSFILCWRSTRLAHDIEESNPA
jgi:RsiW-degrading membrane proteinase PrsW (M82 family)